MTGALIKRGNLGTKTYAQEQLPVKTGIVLHKPGNP